MQFLLSQSPNTSRNSSAYVILRWIRAGMKSCFMPSWQRQAATLTCDWRYSPELPIQEHARTAEFCWSLKKALRWYYRLWFTWQSWYTGLYSQLFWHFLGCKIALTVLQPNQAPGCADHYSSKDRSFFFLQQVNEYTTVSKEWALLFL